MMPRGPPQSEREKRERERERTHACIYIHSYTHIHKYAGHKTTKYLQREDGMGGLVRTQHVCIYIHT